MKIPSLFAVLFLAVGPVRLLAAPLPYAADQILVQFEAAGSIPGQGLSAGQFRSLEASQRTALEKVHAVSVRPLVPSSGLSKNAHLRAFSSSEMDRWTLVHLDGSMEVPAAVEILNGLPGVRIAEPNWRRYRSRVPNDASYALQWGLSNIGQFGGTSGRDIDAERAWDTQTGAATTIVAVTDTGVDWNHPDLAANIWANSGEIINGADDDVNGYTDDVRGYDFGDPMHQGDNNPDDDSADPGHGTHVSGIAGAVGNNGVGVAGVGWGIRIMPLKVADDLGDMFDSYLVPAIFYAANNGAHVINISLGGGPGASLQSAVNSATAAGVLVVAAAGNDNTSDPVTGGAYPAAYDNAVAVAATDDDDLRAGFSNYGSWVDIAAPGVGIYSTIPTFFIGSDYDFADGTSMASPMVAGVAAVIRSEYPTITVSELRERLLNSTENIDALNPGYAGLLGRGRVNLARGLLGITAVSPSSATIGAAVTLTVTGKALMPGMEVRLTRADASTITATGVLVPSSTQLTGTFDLSGAATGYWNLVMTTGTTSVSLSNAFQLFGFELTSVQPSSAPNTGLTSVVTLNGLNFTSGMSVELQRAGQSPIPGLNLTLLSPTMSTVTFDATGAVGGYWDVVLSNGVDAWTLTRGFTITSNIFDVVTYNINQDYVSSLIPPSGPITLRWPSGTFDQAVSLELNAEPALPPVGPNDPFKTTGIGMEISPSVSEMTLAQPVELEFSYRLSDLPDASLESALTLAVYNGTTQRWEPVASTVDTVARTVSGAVPHLSIFALLQHAPSAALNNVVVFPNPFRVDRGHTKMTFDFLTAGSRVRLYDLSGELVTELTDEDGDGQVTWATTNDGGEKVASGIYLYMVTDASGQKHVGRLGVVR